MSVTVRKHQTHHKYKSAHDKSYNKTCATSKYSDQAAHPCSLIRVCADRMGFLQSTGYSKRNHSILGACIDRSESLLVPPKFMINGTIFILIESISLFWMAVFPGAPHLGYTYLSLLDSPGLLQILVTLTAVIKPFLIIFLGSAVVTSYFVRRFRNFITDTGPS